MQVEVPCEPVSATHSCRATYDAPKTPGASGACNQGDHLIAYNCDDFRGVVEQSGWRCATAWEAMGRPDEWIMHKYGIYDGRVAETRKVESWVTDHERRQFLCIRLAADAAD